MQIIIDQYNEGRRVDKFLRGLLVNSTLSNIYKLLRLGKIKVNNKKIKHSYKLKQNDIVNFYISKEDYERLTKREKIKTQRIDFKILYEDSDILIVDKPAFLASHSGTGVMENNLIDQVKFYLGENYEPSLINRLDRETSGIVIIGKNKKSTRILNKLMHDRKIEKYYLALVKGILDKKKGTIKTFISRYKEKFQHKAMILEEKDEKSKLAKTKYKVIKEFNNYSLLELELETGRMHQIRAHLSSIGFPVVGDKIYGNKEEDKKLKLNRLFLHAYKIILPHPITRKKMNFESELPSDLKKLI